MVDRLAHMNDDSSALEAARARAIAALMPARSRSPGGLIEGVPAAVDRTPRGTLALQRSVGSSGVSSEKQDFRPPLI
jgi:hypothetical protein